MQSLVGDAAPILGPQRRSVGVDNHRNFLLPFKFERQSFRGCHETGNGSTLLIFMRFSDCSRFCGDHRTGRTQSVNHDRPRESAKSRLVAHSACQEAGPQITLQARFANYLGREISQRPSLDLASGNSASGGGRKVNRLLRRFFAKLHGRPPSTSGPTCRRAALGNFTPQ
jgi:hypothetical protein